MAETQQAAEKVIQTLESSLQQIDDAIEAAIAQNGIVVDDNDLAPLKNIAVQDVRDALAQISAARDNYTGELCRAMDSMRAEGYTPTPIDGADGDGINATMVASQEADGYNAEQRAADQALVDGMGPVTPEKAAAIARLRDYATIQKPSSDPDAVRLAGERLDDFMTARQPSGTLPPDPMLGTDPQRRALVRQEWQKQLELGTPQMPAMTPDEATAWMDEQEARVRVAAVEGTVTALENEGLSRAEATAVVDAVSRGASWSDLAYAAEVAGPLGEINQVDGGLSDGRHSLPWDRYSPETLKTVSNFGKAFGTAGSLLEVGAAYYEWRDGAPPRGNVWWSSGWPSWRRRGRRSRRIPWRPGVRARRGIRWRSCWRIGGLDGGKGGRSHTWRSP